MISGNSIKPKKVRKVKVEVALSLLGSREINQIHAHVGVLIICPQSILYNRGTWILMGLGVALGTRSRLTASKTVNITEVIGAVNLIFGAT